MAITVKGKQGAFPAGGKLRYNSPQNFFTCFFFSLLGIFFFTSVTQAQVTYQYDTYSSPYTGTPNGTGRVTSVTDPTGSTTFFYDARGNITKTIKVIEGNSFTVESTYDSLNRVATTTYPDTPNPEVVTNTYDAAGNLKTVTSPATSYVTDITYNTFNQRTKITFGNNVSTAYNYDSNSFRLSEICTRLTLDCSDPASTPAVLEKLSYGYDAVGNVISITDLLAASNNQTFGYDSLNRLTVAKGVYGDFTNTPYQYDPIGNMTYNPLVGSYTYPQSGIASVRPHAVETAGGTNNTYTYDGNGNMTSGPGRTVTYNMENRPTSIVNTITNKTVTMAYDYKANRIKRAVGPEITYYVGDLYEKKGSVTEKYIFAGSTRVALKNSGGSTYFYHSDHLGSTHLMTNAAGVKEEEVYYAPFGATVSRSGPVDVKHKYTGQELDTDAELYYYKARYYNHVLGRFVTPDTVGIVHTDPQTLNRYSYVLNNPLRFNDPTGHCSSQTIIGGSLMTASSGSCFSNSGMTGQMQLTGSRQEAPFGVGTNSSAYIDTGLSIWGKNAVISVSDWLAGSSFFSTKETVITSTRENFNITTGPLRYREAFSTGTISGDPNAFWGHTVSTIDGSQSWSGGPLSVSWPLGMAFETNNFSMGFNVQGPAVFWGWNQPTVGSPQMFAQSQTTVSADPFIDGFRSNLGWANQMGPQGFPTIGPPREGPGSSPAFPYPTPVPPPAYLFP
ncbi:MAG: RHS repeat-associated core domain-containing protein [Candidatus Manganitrophaceae bacterium]